MKVFTALLWREIAGRRLLLLASALLGLVPIVLPWVPGRPERHTPEEIRTAVALVLAALFGLAALLMLGSTIVARDLSEKRLGFYFSRPISGWALWGARMTAAAALIVASLLLIVAPAATVDAGSWLEGLSDLHRGQIWPFLSPTEALQQQALYAYFGELNVSALPVTPKSPPLKVHLLLGLGRLLLLLAIVHAVSSAVRGRSAWLLADLAGLAIVSSLVWSARERLLAEQALGALVWVEWLLVPAVLAVLLLAGGVQLAAGRTDLARSHRCLSLTLWPGLLAVALVLTGYSWWVATSSVEDLVALTHVEASPDERWLAVAGPGRGHAEAAFLLDARSGRSWRLGNPDVARVWLTFSADGTTAVWPKCETLAPLSCEIWAADLRDPSQPPRRTEIAVVPELGGLRPPLHLRLALSADGTRLALADKSRLSVHELSSGRLLAAVAAKHAQALAFLSPHEIDFHEPVSLLEDHGFLRLRTFDLRTREVSENGRLPRGREAVRSPAGDVLFHQGYNLEAGLYDRVQTGLYDRATVVPLVEIEDAWTPESNYGRFLADGRFVLGLRRRGVFELTVFSASGETEHRFLRPGVQRRIFGGELSPGRLLIALEEAASPAAPAGPVEPIPGWTTYVLDAATGELEPLAAGVVPLGASQAPERLFLGGRQTVIRWNPETGEAKTVLPPFAVPRGAELALLGVRNL